MDAISETIIFNGVNGATGEYFFSPMTLDEITNLARGKSFAPRHLEELRARHSRTRKPHLGPKEGIAPDDLAEAGWGVIFSRDCPPAVHEALLPLLDHRRFQASRRKGHYYREFFGRDAPKPAETKGQFLARHGVGPGPADPEKVPYYLLLVGSPVEISYEFQYQLDVQYAVGRVHFETPEEYACYAASVVAAETGSTSLSRQAAFFGVRQAGDLAMELTHDHLVSPLATLLDRDLPDWTISTVTSEEAIKDRLRSLLGGRETPALLFTGSHGVGFPDGDPLQRSRQGALLCQDWPGPRSRPGRLSPDHYLSAGDIGDDADIHGLIAFHFACYSAGTPERNSFIHRGAGEVRRRAPEPFVARLPQRLLSHPRGGALAVIGHVDRVWTYSFGWPRAGEQLVAFESTMKSLMAGRPVGLAMEYFNQRYAEISSELNQEIMYVQDWGARPRPLELSGMWTANNDARNYAVFGDPAVRLSC